jgi:hypothetical protein
VGVGERGRGRGRVCVSGEGQVCVRARSACACAQSLPRDMTICPQTHLLRLLGAHDQAASRAEACGLRRRSGTRRAAGMRGNQ